MPLCNEPLRKLIRAGLMVGGDVVVFRKFRSRPVADYPNSTRAKQIKDSRAPRCENRLPPDDDAERAFFNQSIYPLLSEALGVQNHRMQARLCDRIECPAIYELLPARKRTTLESLHVRRLAEHHNSVRQNGFLFGHRVRNHAESPGLA